MAGDAGLSGAGQAGQGGVEGSQRAGSDSGRYLSTRLIPALLAADAAGDAASDPESADASSGLPARLLAVVREGLECGLGAFVAPDSGRCFAVDGMPAAARELVESHGGGATSGEEPLIRRAIEEGRAFLLSASSRHPLMVAVREAGPGVCSMAVVPFVDQGRTIAIGIFGSGEARTLTAPNLSSLAPAFRVLALLLSVRGGGAPDGVGARDQADDEGYLVELEELGVRLAEAEERVRLAEEGASTVEAENRASAETLRARIHELEVEVGNRQEFETRARELEGKLEALEEERSALQAQLGEKGAAIDEGTERRRSLEAQLADLTAECERNVHASSDLRAQLETASGEVERLGTEIRSRDETIARLESELAGAAVERPDAVAPTAAGPAVGDAGVEVSEEPAVLVRLEPEEATAGATASEAPVDEALDDGLGDIVAEAAAVVADEAGPEGEPAAATDGEAIAPACEELVLDAGGESEDDSAAAAEEESEEASERTLVQLDSIESNREQARAIAESVGTVYWDGDGIPAARDVVVAVNVLDDRVSSVLEVARAQPLERSLHLYGQLSESDAGFELGPVGLIERPLEAEMALERIQAFAGGKLSGVVIVSGQLRELAGLREALSNVDAAGSVACDSRQALDLLEIVRRPNAIVVDLALEGGQGLALAHQLRHEPNTADLPLLFLLPQELRAEQFRTDAESAGLLHPFGGDQLQSMLRQGLAPHC